MANVISFSRSQSDHIKQLLLLFINLFLQAETIYESGPPPLAEVENGEDERDFEDVEDDQDKSSKNIFQIGRDFWSESTQKMTDRMETFAENRWGPMDKLYIYENTTDFLYSIDENSRKVFPVIFLILQLIYWTSYLYIL